MPRIRVLVVEDSLTVRQRLVEALAEDPQIEVVGQAEDGKAAIDLCQFLHPDVMTLDMVLPLLSGLAVTEYVMAYCPVPILIVSASTNRGDLYKTYEALAAGAVDVLEKPNGREPDGAWEREFLAAIRMVARIKVITHVRGRRLNGVAAHSPAAAPEEPGAYRAVAIGASTGGPAALVAILRHLPHNYPLPLLVVNHIGDKFGPLFAEWLDSQSALRVSSAVDGEPLPEVGSARVIVAPPGRHLTLGRGCLCLSAGVERHSCRPSVDVLFESVAAGLGNRAIACLLTGMGKDGAAGLLAVRQAGGFTVAQDEATSVIFGMPREAIRLGAALRIAGLHEIATLLRDLAEAPSFPARLPAGSGSRESGL